MKKLDYKKCVDHLNKEGYLILRNFFPVNTIKKAAEYLEKNDYSSVSRITSYKKKAFLKISYDKNIIKLTENFFKEDTAAIQSLLFKYPSQQAIHQDTVHFSTYPRDLMIACWVALEDINEDQGPLQYIPKSHLLPTFTKYEFPNKHTHQNLNGNFYSAYEKELSNLVMELDFKAVKFCAKAGDCFLWHPRLWHGGSAATSKNKTRYSYVTHYMAKETPIYFKHFQGINFFPRFQNPKELKDGKSLYKFGLFSMLKRIYKLI